MCGCVKGRVGKEGVCVCQGKRRKGRWCEIENNVCASREQKVIGKTAGRNQPPFSDHLPLGSSTRVLESCQTTCMEKSERQSASARCKEQRGDPNTRRCQGHVKGQHPCKILERSLEYPCKILRAEVGLQLERRGV